MATTRKPRSPKTPVAEAIDVQASFIEDEDAGISWKEFKSKMPKFEPGWQRTVASVTVGILVSCGIGYAFGTALGYMLIGAATCGVNVFMQAVMYLIGICISAYFGRMAGTVACEFVANRRVDVMAYKAYDSVTGWFKSEPQGVAA